MADCERNKAAVSLQPCFREREREIPPVDGCNRLVVFCLKCFLYPGKCHVRTPQ